MSLQAATESEAATTAGVASVAWINATAKITDQIDDINMFAKMIKKAEEAAQAAV